MAAWESAPLVETQALGWQSAPSLEDQKQAPESTVARRLGIGTRDVIEGVTALPTMALDALTYPGRLLNRALGIQTTAPSDLVQKGLDATGLPKPETESERQASSVIQPVAGTLTGVGTGGVLARSAQPAVRAIGEALQAQPGTQALAAGVGGATEQATGSPTAGMVASLATPFATTGVGAGARAVERGLLGANISEADAKLGQLAHTKYNIPINTTDLTDNSLLRIGQDQAGKLPFSGARASADAKQRSWQGAIANEMGETGASAFTPDVMTKAKDRIGQTFEDVAQRTSIPQGEIPQLLTDLGTVLPDARKVLDSGQVEPLANQIKEITGIIARNNGTISGDAYQVLTRAKGPLDLLESSTDTAKAHFAGKIRDALDDAFARSASPADQEALQKARYQYRVMRTIDPLVAGSRDGNITPDGFMQKVLTASRRFDSPTSGMAYTGGGNIGELARIGKLMRAAPQTGTADRLAVNLATGAGLAGLYNLTPGGVAVTGGTLAANSMAGHYLRSQGAAERLIMNALGQQRPNDLLRALQTSSAAGLENAAQQNQNDLLRR